MRNRWAVLIGVNFYRNPTNRLHGCVRDVRNIKPSLEADVRGTTIFTLTASNTPNSASDSPTEPEDVWPTPDRVKQTLDHVILHRKEGDFVYFHYSGHGAQVQSNVIDSSTDGNQDFALALVDTTNKESYLSGQELAQNIQLMVAKGLRVTVILDCCFSGSVPRHGSTAGAVVRTVAPRLSRDSTSSRDVCSGSALSETILFRGARIVPQWLVNPKGYSILMACGPHERAYELRVNREPRGALSHFLCRALSSLRKARTKISLKALFRNLCVHFHANFPQQTPMRYGNDEESFFSCLESIWSMDSVSVFRRTGDDQLCLTAGYAHGVEKGDEYILSPFYMQLEHDSSAMKDPDDPPSIRAIIDSVSSLIDRADCLAELASFFENIFLQIGEIQSLEKAILVHRESIDLTPSSELGLRATRLHCLGKALREHSLAFGDKAGLENAVETLEQAVDLTPSDLHDTRADRFTEVAVLVRDKSKREGKNEDLDKAILMFEKALDTSSSNEGGIRADRLFDVSLLLRNKFSESVRKNTFIGPYARAMRPSPSYRQTSSRRKLSSWDISARSWETDSPERETPQI
ncbi:hypothetical protein N7493_008102 [Penicillium malachiteum]|uniref:Peptidase C14 caspase domain-containing protein n=1 Tax=Penicillium malachiteum TaxID=1324776 RepID=A0AAD6HGI5_9EURO|nr:hypothetical protein N7493_008102 [Penicillium malachiteum]